MSERRALLVLAIILCGVAACGAPEGRTRTDAEAPADAAAPATDQETGAIYYGGLATRSTPDGEMLGATEVLLKRSLDPDRGLITDSVLTDGRFRQVLYRRTAEAGVMAVEPADGSYSGTVSFSPDPWTPTEWTYDFRLRDGGSITGTGRRSEAGPFVIETWLAGPDGARQEKTLERRRRLEPAVFEAKRRALVR